MSFSDLDRFLRKKVSTGDLAGAVCWVGTVRDELFCEAYGHRSIIPPVATMDRRTLFDIASLTKPLATALAVMTLHEDGRIGLEDTVAQYLDEFKDSPNEDITVMQLLTHTSGLAPWYPLYTLPQGQRLAFLAAHAAEKDVVYSCLGYVLLGALIERIAGAPLDEYCRDRLYGPLGVRDTLFDPAGRDNVAATELGSEYEKDLASRHADISGVPWRDHLLCGEVHDGNAFYAFQGVAGNAGLFSTTDDLAMIARAYLRGEIVGPGTMRHMTTDHTGGDEKRGLGWVMDAYPDLCSCGTFSHTGFTGTMLLCDPQRSLIVILLANAVHPRVRREFMAPVRTRVLQFISRAVGKKDG